MSSNPQWPKEVLEKYESVRILGKGGFASVFLAKRKSTTEESKEKFVAMKLVRAKTKTETHYAHREIGILKEINHPNIMKLMKAGNRMRRPGLLP
jgi:serine/threonine protein kinase